MSDKRKHADVVESMDEYTTRLNAGEYAAPWVVYVKNENGGYDIIYSRDGDNIASNIDPNYIEAFNERFYKIETEKVYCYEDEYDALVANPTSEITIHNIVNGIVKLEEHTFDPTKLYCVYEEESVEGGEETEDETTEDEPSVND